MFRYFRRSRLAQAITQLISTFTNKTALLLQGGTVNNGQNNTFIDRSNNNFAITRNGNVAQGSFSPFSPNGWSVAFNGSTDLLQTSPLPGPGIVFTVEGWVFPTGFVNSETLLIQNLAGGFQVGHNNTAFGFASSGMGWRLTGGSFTLNTWNHFAIVRQGTGTNQTSIFINGVRTANGTVTDGFMPSATTYNIGAATSTTYQFPGHISNLRIVAGTALYDPAATTISVPTTKLTAVSGTVLLTCQDNTFKDTSANNATFSVTGTPKVVAFSPFGQVAYSAATHGGSAYFDGTGDYLVGPSNSVFAFNTDNWTMEAWIYPVAYATVGVFMAISAASGNGVNSDMFVYLRTDGKIVLSSHNTAYFASSKVVPLNQWTHIAVTCVGATTAATIYINGVAAGSGNTYRITTNTPFVGGTPTYNFTGYVSDARFTKDLVYTSQFTPPTTPLSAIANTQLLVAGKDATIYDVAGINDAETVGAAKLTNSVVKYNGTSMQFTTAGDRLVIPPNPLFNFVSGDFTVEFWLHPLGLPTGSNVAHLIGTADPNFGNNGWSIELNPTGVQVNGNGTSQAIYTASISMNTWHHIALCRSGTSVYCFMDGVSLGVNTITGNQTLRSAFLYNPATPLYVGAHPSYPSQCLNGYLDDVRITRSAIYSTSFVPPKAALTLY